MGEIAITNVVNVSVAEPQVGLNNYNTSNLAIFTHETPSGSFGTLGYKSYVTPGEVETDFGTSSKTAKMANYVFSQQPNILTGNGQLVVVLMLSDHPAVTAVQKITFSSLPDSGTIQYGDDTNWTGDVPAGVTAGDLQTALRTVSGWEDVTVAGDETIGFTITMTGVVGPTPNIKWRHNSLQDDNPYDVFPTVETTVIGVAPDSKETLGAAITRTKASVQYFGIMESATIDDQGQSAVLAAAIVVQALKKIVFFVSFTRADIQSGGTIDLLRTGGYNHSRGLYYGDNTADVAIQFMAGYAGRALSTDFSGSNTTQTMHLKQLKGVQPDLTIDQTILDEAKDSGADIYVSIEGGVPAVFCSKANKFFDQVYNLLWYVGALQVAGFNYIQRTSTKIYQTESGMDGLKGAYRQVSEQAVNNGYCRPGTWTSNTTFGNPANLLANIEQRGYYIYSLPIGQQNQADREDRIAPLVQIALKEGGAIHKSNVIVNINA